MNSPIKVSVKQLSESLSVSDTSQFVSVTYTSKSGRIVPEKSRIVLNTNVNLRRLYNKDLVKLKAYYATLQLQDKQAACKELIDSLEKSLAAGIGNNTDYTRRNSTTPVNKTIRLVANKDKTSSLEIVGVLRSKKVLEQGQYKTVNSSQKTILKNKIKNMLNLSSAKIRCLRLNSENIESIRFNKQQYALG